MSDADYRSRIYESYFESFSRSPDKGPFDDREERGPYLRRMIGQHFPQDRNATILDVGAGAGALIHFARQAGYENILGVDRSGDQVAEAIRRGFEGIVEGDLMDTLASLPLDSHDLIIAFDVIEHLTRNELLEMADGVRRVLKPGGKWIIHTPNAESPFFGRVRYGDFTHELAFTASSIRQVLTSSGFRDVQSYEDAPIAHGAKSAIRYVLWRMIRTVLRVYIAAETGYAGRGIFSQNFLVVAVK